MISKLQHLQLAKLHPSTRVTSTKSVASNQLGFKAKRCNLSSFSFSFVFLFHFFLFSFGRHIGLLFMGVLNLLKVVNDTRIGCAK